MTDHILKMLTPADKALFNAARIHLGLPESRTKELVRAILRKGESELGRANSRPQKLRVVQGGKT